MPRKNPFKLNVVSIRLVKDAPIYSERPIKTPLDAVDVIGSRLCEMDREVLCVINLKTDGTPINCHIVSVGTLNETIASPREMFKTSILSNAANIILLHCHPSGSLKPSSEDFKLTDRMIKLCGLMGIPLLDHIIVGGSNSRYFSFRDNEILFNPNYASSNDYQTLDFGATIAI
ncbi:JAB domain-containing protein [Anaerocolumna xylanovorans]|uniref:DNA repair protein RadC n=1 Tax=Anaerocolumna xylanovorans DSM 12503 TaxID=1121345 RepID=A0A1M7YNJ6_9FIRM|nr:JAB domain-containing protein [Anaerocolumna xylanovorans]SHO54157.1 DNA repair protein RadC [Anaerocolumna xylanovorans DSM 12503]